MSTLLRPSSRQLARHALSAAQATPRISARGGVRIPRFAPKSTSAAAYLLPRRRYYSTNPTPPPPRREDKNKNSDNAQEQKGGNGPVKRPQLPEGWIYLNKEEAKILEDVLGTAKTLPGAIMGVSGEEIIENVKKHGAPLELQELIHKHATKGITIADAMKIMSIAAQLADRMARMDVEKMFNSKEPEVGATRSDKVDAAKGAESTKSERQQQTQEERHQQHQQQQQQQQKRKEQDGHQKKKQQGKPNEKVKVLDVTDILGWCLAAALFMPLWGMIFPSETHEISWSELRRNYLDKGLVKKLVVIKRDARCLVKVELNNEAVRSVYPDSPAANNPYATLLVTVGSADMLERHLDEAQDELGIPSTERIPVIYEAGSQLGNLLLAFGPTLLFVGLLFYLQRRGPGGGGAGGGMFGFGKSKAKMYNHESAVKVKFSDVAGMDEAKVEIMEFVSFLKTPERFQKLGAKIPRGAILSGPPGTGKTLLAKATAGESQVPFFSVSGSEFVEMFVGVGASRVRDLFAQARKNAPCIVFIDEIDAIGRSRADGNRGFGGNEEREATLNQILTEMDGFNTQEQIVVLAGTNRPDVLDKALMRPGRFDRQIYIDRPTMKGRVAIFKVHLKKIVTKEEIEHLCGRLSALTPGFSGADIANAVNEAALVGMCSLDDVVLHRCNTDFFFPSPFAYSCQVQRRKRHNGAL